MMRENIAVRAHRKVVMGRRVLQISKNIVELINKTGENDFIEAEEIIEDMNNDCPWDDYDEDLCLDNEDWDES